MDSNDRDGNNHGSSENGENNSGPEDLASIPATSHKNFMSVSEIKADNHTG